MTFEGRCRVSFELGTDLLEDVRLRHGRGSYVDNARATTELNYYSRMRIKELMRERR